jgi:hypothetical protein
MNKIIWRIESAIIGLENRMANRFLSVAFWVVLVSAFVVTG